jgi:glycosyltransferase involved in cell wall biosynthesis
MKQNKPIPVLHLIKTLNLGGAETNLLNLIHATDRDRYDIHVGYSFGGEIESRFLESGVKLFKYADQNHKVKSIATFGIVWRIARYVFENGIRIIHTHNFSAHIWGSMAAKLTGRKLVEHVHDFRYVEDGEFRKRRGENNQYKYARLLRNVSDRVVVLTRDNEAFLQKKRLYEARRIREIQNGIPMPEKCVPTEFEKRFMRSRYGIASDVPVVLTSARLAPEKNIDLILRIAPDVLAKVPDAVFLVSGDGPLLDDLRARCHMLGLESNVRFIGYHSEMTDLLAASDVYLLPSFLELHSIGILEAMSMKLPIVVSKGVGCNDEFIDDWNNGVLLDPFSDEGWADALVTLLSNPVLRLEIGTRAYETCKSRFNIENTVKKIEDMYAELAR